MTPFPPALQAPQNVVIASIPSVFDPSHAPPGKAVVHCYTAGNEPWELWEGLKPGSAEYRALKVRVHVCVLCVCGGGWGSGWGWGWGGSAQPWALHVLLWVLLIRSMHDVRPCAGPSEQHVLLAFLCSAHAAVLCCARAAALCRRSGRSACGRLWSGSSPTSAAGPSWHWWAGCGSLEGRFVSQQRAAHHSRTRTGEGRGTAAAAPNAPFPGERQHAIAVGPFPGSTHPAMLSTPWLQVGSPLTHQRFLRRYKGTYGPAISAAEGSFPGPQTPVPGLFRCVRVCAVCGVGGLVWCGVESMRWWVAARGLDRCLGVWRTCEQHHTPDYRSCSLRCSQPTAGAVAGCAFWVSLSHAPATHTGPLPRARPVPQVWRLLHAGHWSASSSRQRHDLCQHPGAPLAAPGPAEGAGAVGGCDGLR